MELILLLAVAITMFWVFRYKSGLSKRTQLIISIIVGFIFLSWILFFEPEVALHYKALFVALFGSSIYVNYRKLKENTSS